MICYLDFDDMHSPVFGLEDLRALRELDKYFDDFKCNMFVSAELPMIMNPLPGKISYNLHGNLHGEYEELTMDELKAWPFDKVYRAPYWTLSNEMYAKLKTAGYKICLNTFDPKETREGIYFTWNIKESPDLSQEILFGHGHVGHSENGLALCKNNILMLPRDTEFKFLRDCT